MDTLAHGLWGGVAFGRLNRKNYWTAFVLGMMPDLLSFGPFFVLWALRGFEGRTGGPPDPAMIPAYVYHAYDVTHSLVVWSVAALIAWKVMGKFPWPFAAWPLHILCDMPLHSIRFFPTPYLWPLPTPFIDGMMWGKRWFMILNYSALALAYILAFNNADLAGRFKRRFFHAR